MPVKRSVLYKSMNKSATETPVDADQNPEKHVAQLGANAKAAAMGLASASTRDKNEALLAIADALDAHADELMSANQQDMAAARERNLDAALLDRLELTPARLQSMSAGVRNVAGQSDPVGAMSAGERQVSGLVISKMRVPLGVIGVIYESRPNVTADAAAICLKSGNAVILRGGSESIFSNRVIARCVRESLEASALPSDAVQLVNTTNRDAVGALLKMEDYVDVIIPRGGKGLVSRISEDARVPVIKHLDGICHVYVDTDCDLDMALSVAVNSKTYRYGICGSMETLLVAESEASAFLPMLNDALAVHEVNIRGCEQSLALQPHWEAASDADWTTEYLGPILSVKVVSDVDEAIDHINLYGSAHTDAIVTNDIQRSDRFVRRVDSSSVLVNAATCFADGAEYGLGAEIGISTNRMHVRGPVGVMGLTCEKYVVTGNGTIRQ